MTTFEKRECVFAYVQADDPQSPGPG